MTEQHQTETEDQRIRRLIDERLSEVVGQEVGVTLPGEPGNPSPAPQAQGLTLADVLDQIDPRDSDSAIELFGWLVDHGRLQRVATLTQGGYMFIYQEPEGASKQGWTAGGTTGDRIVDDALDQAKESNGRVLKGLCKHCYSAISAIEGLAPQAENPRPGEDPAICPKGDEQTPGHEFAG